MKLIKYIHPDFPNAKKPFEMAIDLANVSTVMNNGSDWVLSMENGQKVKMMADGKYHAFVDACTAAKAQRDLSNMMKRGS